jgi:hypothetical protein
MLSLFAVVDGCGTQVFAGLRKVGCVVAVRKWMYLGTRECVDAGTEEAYQWRFVSSSVFAS